MKPRKRINFFSVARILIILLIIFIGGLVLFTDNINLVEPHPNTSIAGSVLNLNGMVLIKTKNNPSFVNMEQNQTLGLGVQTIVTGFESSAEINFGETFEILENSSIKIQGERHRVVVYVDRGAIQRSNPKDNVVFILDNEEQKSLKIQSPNKMTLTGQTFQQNSGATNIPDLGVPLEFQQLLTETIKLHQRFIEKCIIKLYERKKGNLEKGTVHTRFTLNKKGRIENASVTESPYQDPIFIDCIEEVISRVRFKGYKGQSKTVNFPIEIQLPN